MNEKESVNWVRNRHECSLDFIFGQLLLRQFETDATEANKISGTKRFSVHKEYDEGTASDFIYVRRDSSHRHQVMMVLDDKEIRVQPYKDSTFTVTQKWTDETAECILCVDGTRIEPWQISRRALSALFFGD